MPVTAGAAEQKEMQNYIVSTEAAKRQINKEIYVCQFKHLGGKHEKDSIYIEYGFNSNHMCQSMYGKTKESNI